ncbi:alpha/beta hydrolase [Flavihumibacter sp. RY-1]|uniref:Alpha/beta hydrolase n=1 Tax=Flavihumibacter fluminis TaxID=2909236 RepID=A0ABS9BEG7_9BACT|nr:alpha/beta hydrolase [Flavihumibacter fluminis]MCF1713685.1 alpha/beta hydrolase [Flavihumibacter fluminis]
MKKKVLLTVFILAQLLAFSSDTTQMIRTSDSVNLFVHISGKGAPVLFLHGGPGSNSGYFEHTGGNIFEQEVQMVYLDQRGCGRSGKSESSNYSLTRMVQDFEEVRKSLGIKQWIVMAHSFGGILATAYATAYPDAIKAMVYLNCTVNIDSSATSGIKHAITLLEKKGKTYPELTNDTIPLLQRWGQAFGKLREEDLFYGLMFNSRENFQYHDSVTLVYGKEWDFGNKVWGYKEYFEDFIPATARINCPVLIIGGTKDYTIGIRHPELMRFPVKQVKYVEGGHALYFESREQLYKAVLPFLKKYGKTLQSVK